MYTTNDYYFKNSTNFTHSKIVQTLSFDAVGWNLQDNIIKNVLDFIELKNLLLQTRQQLLQVINFTYGLVFVDFYTTKRKHLYHENGH